MTLSHACCGPGASAKHLPDLARWRETQAELTEKGRAVVGEVSRELHKLPRGSTIEIHGHTACPTQGSNVNLKPCGVANQRTARDVSYPPPERA